MPLLHALCWVAWACAAVTIGAAGFDAWHPALDSFGVWLLYGVAVAALCTGLFGLMRRWAGTSCSLALLVMGLVQIFPHAATVQVQAAPTGLRLLQHNLKFLNAAQNLEDRITGMDIVALQEVLEAGPTLDGLDPTWDAHLCPFGAVGGPAVLTQLEVTERGCFDGGAWARVALPNGPVTVLSLHLHWPWPYGQWHHVKRIREDLAALPRPVIVAGDFNQTPWSETVARVAQATDTQPIPDLRTTLVLGRGLARINIDHVLLPDGWSGGLTILGTEGSDHNAVVAQIAGPSL